MKTEDIFLKETPLRANCPECYATDGLQLSFNQKQIVSKLFKRVTKNIEEDLDCKNCETKIYPGRWTDDIERMYEYHRKTILPKKSGIQFTSLSYAIFLILLLGGAAVFFYFYNYV